MYEKASKTDYCLWKRTERRIATVALYRKQKSNTFSLPEWLLADAGNTGTWTGIRRKKNDGTTCNYVFSILSTQRNLSKHSLTFSLTTETTQTAAHIFSRFTLITCTDLRVQIDLSVCFRSVIYFQRFLFDYSVRNH